MYCRHCGNSLEEHFRYCSRCGAATDGETRSAPSGGNRLTRLREGKKIAGVCGGIARHLDLDVTLVRVVWILLVILPPVPGTAVLAYLICWAVMPLEDPPPIAQQQECSPQAG